MSTHRLVYHLNDEELFQSFIRSLSHKTLLEPIRKDEVLRNKYFKGYRITDGFPDKETISHAYSTELLVTRNEYLMNYLYVHWLYTHENLSENAFDTMDIKFHQEKRWLDRAHEYLDRHGHKETAKSIVRSLAIGYPSSEIHIFISIISENYEDQSELRQLVEDEIKLTQSNPHVLRDHLHNQLNRITSQLAALTQSMEDIEVRRQTREATVENQTVGLREDLKTIHVNLQNSESTLVTARKELDAISEKIRAQSAIASGLKQKKDKLEGQIEHMQARLCDDNDVDRAKLSKLKTDYDAVTAEEKQVREQIVTLEARIREENEKAEVAKNTDNETKKEGSEEVQHIVDATPLCPVEWTTAFADDLYKTLSFSSCVTLHLIWLRSAGLLDLQSQYEKPDGDYVVDSAGWRDYYAQRSLASPNAWDRSNLAWYAWLRTLLPGKDTRENLLDFVVSGLYHAARSNDDDITDLLLGRLLELSAGVSSVNQAPGDLPKVALAAVEAYGNNPEALRFFGLLQSKVASASPQALVRLYDRLPARSRIIAKRSLVAHLVDFGLNEQDPGHEMIDVICTTIQSHITPFVGSFRSWCKRATLQTIVNDRSTLLRISHKLLDTFSNESQRRLSVFRQLFGKELSDSMAQGRPEDYALLKRRCVEFIDSELRSPEWISARFLLPLVVELARCSSNADVEIRMGLRANLSAILEKTQHPIGVHARELNIGLSIINRGTAPAENVTFAAMPTRISEANVELKNAEFRVPKILVGEPGFHHDAIVNVVIPCPAIELEYLITWTDPSASDRSDVGKLKLTAQRAVDWNKARSNPYSLRSITDPNRLYGREPVLDRLRIGIMGMQSFYLTGQRRVGKSSVARVLYNEFDGSNSHIPIYITLGELTTTSVGSMMYSLQKALAENSPHPIRKSVIDALPSESDFMRELGAAARTFQRSLDEIMPNGKFLCLVDDFDELPQELYKGTESDALFLHFRTLIDRGNFSFIFVGSERLPDILRRHGEKLNQVKPINLDYLDNIRGMVREPAQPYLEFSEDAVELIHRYSAGNPYYATQICLRLYGDMILNRDHYVGAGDVQKSVASIVNEESVSTFQHFWKDGVFEGSVDVEKLQQINAALLIACSALEGVENKPVDRRILLDSELLRKYDEAVLRFQLDNLIDRRVIDGHQESLHLRVPLLSMWLRGIGSAVVQSSFGDRDLDVAIAPVHVGVNDRAILEIAKDLVYQNKEVSDILIKTWLEQFGGRRDQELAFALLRRLKVDGYFCSAKIYTTFKRIHSLIIAENVTSGQWAQRIQRGRISNIFVTSIGGEGKSGASLLYSYRQANQISANLAGSIEDAANFLKKATRPTAIVFVDDFIGSGQTCIENAKTFGRLISRKELEDAGHLVCVAALVGIRTGKSAIEAATDNQYHVFLGEEFESKHRAFSPDAAIFSSDKDRLEAEALCRAIGEVLEPKQPLGYADCQSLLTFEHRCPNNTLPIFHKVGKSYRGRDWLPLFPR